MSGVEGLPLIYTKTSRLGLAYDFYSKTKKKSECKSASYAYQVKRKNRVELENREHAKRLVETRRRENRKKYWRFYQVVESEAFKVQFLEAAGIEWDETDNEDPEYAMEIIADVAREYLHLQDQIKKEKEWERKLASAYTADRVGNVYGTRFERMRVATPVWRDQEKIKQIYQKRAEMGEGYHVDHIIPIAGVLVCGLHVHQNLRIVSRRENIRKGNKFRVDLIT